ncbi:GGDEF domain-containing protein [Aureimonas leprariae]|uniref:diguanylate cyclase n=1 Tax=Plantimonas leprariae TaxID=2615207 RepID=A0A7V7PNK0_9HYPH|nr:GGDEF domain-containing protein [Aureimonas leprariae]KAB0679268.1 GGDEF domain-containing protein [Aureimonas leprariae]
MRIDVSTLYLLIVGTTFVGACLTLWQRRTMAAHQREMGFWAAGYGLVGLGCLLRMFDGGVASFVSIGLSNVALLLGYAAITAGAMLFGGRRIAPSFVVAVAAFALGWLVWGQYAPVETRIVVTGLALAGLSFQAASALGERHEPVSLASRRLVRAMFAAHGAFFLLRIGVTLSGIEGEVLFSGANFAATMIEGVLWSAFAPAALLMMAREATERRLVAASETDFLTGVDNRRAFTAKATLLLAEQPLAALVVFDLDHFKTINDRHGHGVGDEVLRTFCRVVAKELSIGDVFGRLGGEEFAAVFAGCGAEDARRLAAAVSKLYTTEVALHFTLSLGATASAGVAANRPGADLARLLGEADGALYRAKRAGRDQVVIAEAPPIVAASAPLATRAA